VELLWGHPEQKYGTRLANVGALFAVCAASILSNAPLSRADPQPSAIKI
jgi:hypothetical protein